jgi:peptidoglycan hydrolase-like protein with peptidoglycan-binding domain
LTLTFARPVASVLGSRLPQLEPSMPGHWEQVDAHTLSFRPAGLGLGLGGWVHVQLAGQTLAWHVGSGSTLRLQELLARLGYLPVRWRQAAAAPPPTTASEVAAAVSAPHGAFSWRYPQTPASLRALWKPGSWNVVTQGAVMRFQNVHGMATDGVAGPQVWRALMHDDMAGRRSDAGYNYVFVHESIPQSLSLWHNGRVILTSPGNTGIAQAPTAQGTWPVFEHIPVGTMSGTNPDGTHYNDPGIRWISYFHGGDALHAFPRASFGTPQSLGCVELPDAAAAQVWPYTPIGTLVTIES